MAMRAKLSALANILGVLIVAGFASVVLTSALALRELKVNGPVYERIVLGKDLVADILPPPAYVVEAYLEATLAMQDPQSLAKHKQVLVKLKKDYDARQAFWRGQSIDPDVRRKLTVEAHQPALEFWKLLDEQLLPALEAGDARRAQTAYAALQAAYTKHRAAIDETVAATEKMNIATEAYSAEQEGTYTTILWLVSALVLLVALAGVGGVIFGMIRPIRTMTDAMRTLASGQTELVVPALSREDEIGEMAKAVQVFKESAIENEQLKRQQSATRAQAAAAQ